MDRVRIQHRADVITAQRAARRCADEVGFSRSAAAELMIVASELASNILKYGGRGWLIAERVDHPERGVGLRISAEDEGPPFKSFETAQLDGFSDDGPLDASVLVARRGTASGLGAVRRMTDEMSWEPREGGKVVVATRYVRAARRRSFTPGA